jgi:hypothetical protein
MNFRELADRADTAIIASERARQAAVNLDPEAIELRISSANWQDGTMQLQQEMRELLKGALPALLDKALQNLADKADEARAALKAAVNDGPQDPVRAVPNGAQRQRNAQARAGAA